MSDLPPDEVVDEFHDPVVAAYYSVIFGPEPVEGVELAREEGLRRMEAIREAGEAAQALYQRRAHQMDLSELHTTPWRDVLAEVRKAEPEPRAVTPAERAAHERWMQVHLRTPWLQTGLTETDYQALLCDLEPLTEDQLEALLVLQRDWSGTWPQLLAVAQELGTPG